MKQRNSLDLRVPLLIGWWLMWLALSQTPWNVALAPSAIALAHFSVLLVAFGLGAAFVGHAHRASASIGKSRVTRLETRSPRVRRLVYGLGLSATFLLLTSLQLAGAFSTDFVEYFAKLRMGGGEEGSLTGIKPLDTLTKLFAFPVSYGLLLVVLASGVRPLRAALAMCLCNFALFSYLWQVNYPVIHLFWIAVFYLLGRYIDGAGIDRRTLLALGIVCLLLVLSAMNRFGSDDAQLTGAVQHYLVGYHLIGFSFYDFHLSDPNSILHAHSYGRSSLGFLEQLLEHAAKLVGGGYLSASSENSTFNDTAVPIGTALALDFNAFGTLAFTFYRDFGIVGIAVGGFTYGAAVAYGLMNRNRSWVAAGMFYLLAAAWMMGMMVSPVEQTYFWFCLVFLAAFRLASRRRRRATLLPRSRPGTPPTPAARATS